MSLLAASVQLPHGTLICRNRGVLGDCRGNLPKISRCRADSSKQSRQCHKLDESRRNSCAKATLVLCGKQCQLTAHRTSSIQF